MHRISAGKAKDHQPPICRLIAAGARTRALDSPRRTKGTFSVDPPLVVVWGQLSRIEVRDCCSESTMVESRSCTRGHIARKCPRSSRVILQRGSKETERKSAKPFSLEERNSAVKKSWRKASQSKFQKCISCYAHTFIAGISITLHTLCLSFHI